MKKGHRMIQNSRLRVAAFFVTVCKGQYDVQTDLNLEKRFHMNDAMVFDFFWR